MSSCRATNAKWTCVDAEDPMTEMFNTIARVEGRTAIDVYRDIAKCEPGYNSWDEGTYPISREDAVRKAYAEGYARARLDPHGTETPKTRLVKHVDCDRDGFGNTSGGADTYISETGRNVPLDGAPQPDLATEAVRVIRGYREAKAEGVREERSRVVAFLREALTNDAAAWLAARIDCGEHAAESGAEDSPPFTPPEAAEFAARNFERVNRHGPEKTGASTDVHERKCPHDWYMRGSCTCGLGLDVKPAPKALNTVLNEARKDFESLPKSVQEQANRNRERRQAEDALEFGEPAPKAKRPAYYVIRRTVTFVREDGLTSRERLYVHENPSDLATTSRPRAARFSLASTARDYRASLNESWSKDARIVRVVARKKGRGA